MEYKILEANGVENENIDGAAFNYFASGGKNGILKSVLKECSLYQPSSNSIAINTGELIIHGFRVKITDPYIQSFSSSPNFPIDYHLVARITLSADRSVSFEIICRQIQNLMRDNLYDIEHGAYEEEIARFTHTPNGITNVEAKLIPILGGYVLTQEDKESIVELIKELIPDIPDLSNYVQKDQFAENEAGKGGLVRGFYAPYGLGQNEGANSVYIIKATDKDIQNKNNQHCPIVPTNLDLAVKTSVTTNTIDLSDDEKTSACEWLGAVKKFPASGSLKLYGTESNGDIRLYTIGNSIGNCTVGVIAYYFDENNNGLEDPKSYNNVSLYTTTPKKPYAAANKKYVDDAVANAGGKLYRHHIKITDKNTNTVLEFDTVSSRDLPLSNGDEIYNYFLKYQSQSITATCVTQIGLGVATLNFGNMGIDNAWYYCIVIDMAGHTGIVDDTGSLSMGGFELADTVTEL